MSVVFIIVEQMTKAFLPRLNHHFIVITAFVFAAFNLQAQDWQVSYQQANTLFQSGEYEKSLTEAKLALAKAKAPQEKAYTLQLITSNDIMLNAADEGLKYIDEEINLFKQAEGVKSKSLAEALKKQISFLQQKGLVKEALAKSNNALECFKSSYGASAQETVLFESSLGNSYLASGDSAKAKTIWDESLPKLSTIAEHEEDYKELLFNSAALDENLKNYSSAEGKYLKLIALLEKENQTDDESYTESKNAIERLKAIPKQITNSNIERLLKEALTLQNEHQTEKALEAYKKAVDEVAKENKNDKTAFSIYINYTMLLLSNRDVKNAEHYLQKAKSLSNGLFKPTDFEYLLVNLNMADLHLQLGNKQQAVDEYAHLYITALSDDVYKHASSFLLNASTALLNENLPQSSVQLLKPLLARLQKGEPNFVNAATNYCDALLAMNKPDSVLLFLNQSKYGNELAFEFKRIEAFQLNGQWNDALKKLTDMNAQPNNSNQVKADIAYQSARIIFKMGDYKKAEKYFQNSLSLYTTQEDQWQVGNSLALLYAKLGNYEKSEKLISDMLTQVPQQHPLHFALMENLAADYIESGEIEKAKSIESKIITEEKEYLGSNHPDYAIALTNLAALYQRENDYTEAKKILEEALTISKNNFGDQSVDYALKESNLGSVLKDMGDYAGAKTALVHAEKVLLDKLGKDHPDHVMCEYNLAMTYLRTANSTLAIPLMQQAAHFYKKQILDLFPAMNEQEQVAFFNKINRVIQDYQQMMIEYGKQNPALIEDLLNFRLATKALLLNSSMQIRESILSGNDQQLKDEFLQWLLLKEQIGKLYNQSQDASTSNQILKLEEKANELEKKISQGSHSFKQTNNERIIDWKKIQEALQPGEAAIEIIRTKVSGKSDSVSYAAIVIRKDIAHPTLVVFVGGKKMETRTFSFYRNSIAFKIEDLRSFNRYWMPLEKALAGIQSIYFSADGIYNKISLSTLLDPISHHFLGERYKIILVSNLRNIIPETQVADAKINNAQLFGPINFGDTDKKTSSSTLRSLMPGSIPELPGTKIEIASIDQLLKNNSWSTSDFYQADASEQSFKNAQRSTVVHIATHGFFIESLDDDNQVVFSSTQAANNPLLRSGLIFSDVSNPSTEDGLLTAYEVKNMNFDRTDLVVLSACETGSGEIRNGEGVYGLQRAFLVSGVKNVLMSLWKVDDEATQQLMVLFYQNLLGGEGKVNALRLAQTELRKKYPAPYFWGSFVLVGKP